MLKLSSAFKWNEVKLSKDKDSRIQLKLIKSIFNLASWDVSEDEPKE